MCNLFVEGIPGSGKSTLLHKLEKELPTFRFFYEGQISPIELAWCSYLTKDEYGKILKQWPEFHDQIKDNTKQEENHFIVSYTKIPNEKVDFYQAMERYEIYGGRRPLQEFKEIVFQRFRQFKEKKCVFECSFFQNIIDELLLFGNYSDKQITEFYHDLIDQMNGEFYVVRLVSTDMRSSLQKIKEERVNEQGEEDWYPAMMSYLGQSPYGKSHKIENFEDLLNYFERRIQLEQKISEQFLQGKVIVLESKNYKLTKVLQIVKG